MGITSNNNAHEIGQMGMGFASYTTLTQSVKVDTWARDTDECFSFMAENGKKFDPLPNPKMKQYGTKSATRGRSGFVSFEHEPCSRVGELWRQKKKSTQ